MQNNNSKNIWVIGDVQGCCVSLESLLNLPDIKNDPNCELWFAGDLINRGPNSLRALRLIMSLGDRAKCILGNHDLHLLAYMLVFVAKTALTLLMIFCVQLMWKISLIGYATAL